MTEISPSVTAEEVEAVIAASQDGNFAALSNKRERAIKSQRLAVRAHEAINHIQRLRAIQEWVQCLFGCAESLLEIEGLSKSDFEERRIVLKSIISEVEDKLRGFLAYISDPSNFDEETGEPIVLQREILFADKLYVQKMHELISLYGWTIVPHIIEQKELLDNDPDAKDSRFAFWRLRRELLMGLSRIFQSLKGISPFTKTALKTTIPYDVDIDIMREIAALRLFSYLSGKLQGLLHNLENQLNSSETAFDINAWSLTMDDVRSAWGKLSAMQLLRHDEAKIFADILVFLGSPNTWESIQEALVECHNALHLASEMPRSIRTRFVFDLCTPRQSVLVERIMRKNNEREARLAISA